jgi:hypothetical protein
VELGGRALICCRCRQPVDPFTDHEDPELARDGGPGPVHEECCPFCHDELAGPAGDREYLTLSECRSATGADDAFGDSPYVGHGARAQAQMARDENLRFPLPPAPVKCGVRCPPGLLGEDPSAVPTLGLDLNEPPSWRDDGCCSRLKGHGEGRPVDDPLRRHHATRHGAFVSWSDAD